MRRPEIAPLFVGIAVLLGLACGPSAGGGNGAPAAGGAGAAPAGSVAKPAGQAGAPAASDPLAALYEAAKKEGELQHWGAIGPEEIAGLKDAFQKRFPGIEIKHFEIRPDDF